MAIKKNLELSWLTTLACRGLDDPAPAPTGPSNVSSRAPQTIEYPLDLQLRIGSLPLPQPSANWHDEVVQWQDTDLTDPGLLSAALLT